ncbi:MAG: hypothetical protein P1U56_01390 [Saprospiraceae bacterium]|nr:hypothetical protein [Saprospiraceae bacterium]
MADVFDFLKNFFNNKQPDRKGIPFLHQAIDFKDVPEKDIIQWGESEQFDSFSKLITKAFRDYYIKGRAQTANQVVIVLDKPHSYGWFIYSNKLQYPDEDYKLLVFVLNMKLGKLGYVTQIAEMKSTAVSKGIETITHMYLKPSLRHRLNNENGLINQLYGNITIEYKAVNGTPLSIKFLAKPYNDSKYHPPMNFDDLNKVLFK